MVPASCSSSPARRAAYRVVLENTGGAPFRFANACAPYVEQLATGTAVAFVLNCARVGEISAHGAVRFAMRIRVPATAKPGVWLLTWSLAPHSWSAPTASMLVAVG